MDDRDKELIIELAAKKVRENDEFAALIAQKVFDIIARDFGKSIIKRIAWLVGFTVIALIFWLAQKGLVKMPEISVH